jgi:hypothetical protein
MTTLNPQQLHEQRLAHLAKLKATMRPKETMFDRLTRLNEGLDPAAIRRYLGKEFVEDTDERDAVRFCVGRDK